MIHCYDVDLGLIDRPNEYQEALELIDRWGHEHAERQVSRLIGDGVMCSPDQVHDLQYVYFIKKFGEWAVATGEAQYEKV